MSGNGQTGPIRLLIADSDQEHRNRLKSALAGHPDFDLLAVVGDGERAARLAAQLQPDVAVIENGLARTDGSDAAESIALTVPSCQLVLIAQHSDPDTIRRAMLTGAREFLVKPVEDDHLVQAIYRVHQFAMKRQAVNLDEAFHASERPQLGQVFCVWGPKGGVGRTFLAVNLAVSLAAVQKRKVLLMDGCLGFCTADVALDIEGKKNILDLIVDHEEDLDPDLISSVAVHHPSGLDVLLAPSGEEMLQIAPIHLQRILSVMRRLYECIIVDTRPLLDETTVAFLDLSDVILTVCNPEIASLRNLRIFLDAAKRLGYGADKVRLVINRHDMRNAIPLAEIEKVCRYPITYTIPNDHDAVANSINRGQPLVTAQPGRPISKDVANLAALLVSNDSNNGHAEGEKAQKTALARLFRRG